MRGRKVNRKMMYIVAFVLCIVIVNVGDMIISKAEENDMVVQYHGCTVNGWKEWVKQGEECKVDSEGLTRLEIKMATEGGQTANSFIEYSVYSAAGWSIPANGGDIASAAGQPIKAFKVNITGDLANSYNVEYRAQNNKGEWLAYSSNGEVIGNTLGEEILTAIEIKIVKTSTGNGPEVNTPSDNTETGDDTTQIQATPAPTPISSQDAEVIQQEQPIQDTLSEDAPQPTLAPGATPEPDMIQYEPTVAPEYSGDDTETTTDENSTNEEGVTPTQTPQDGSQIEETIASDNSVMEAFVAKVVSQMGTGRNEAGNTIYGEWWAERVNNSAFKDAEWCAMFLSWCAKEAGVAENSIGYYAACSYWQDGLKAKGWWSDKAGYTPKRGDLIFFDYSGDGVANHNGVVESVSGNQVVAIEGNVNDKVDRVTYDINDSKILGYGSPDYANNAANLEEQQKQEQEETAQSESGNTLIETLIQVAENEIGTYESSKGWTKYGEWFGDNIIISSAYDRAAWCAMFVSWCANKAGVPTSTIKPYAYCPTGVSNFKHKGVYHSKSGYTPKRGDIIFFNRSNRADHTGIVEYVKDSYVHTIEGNTKNHVDRRQYPLNNSGIMGYGSPNY